MYIKGSLKDSRWLTSKIKLCSGKACHLNVQLKKMAIGRNSGQRSFAVFGPATWNSLGLLRYAPPNCR